MSKKNQAIAMGILSANLLALLFMGITGWIATTAETGGTLILADFVVLPLLMGMVNAYCWRKHEITMGEAWGYGFLNFLVALSGVALFMGEGYICVIIVSPLIIVFLMLGVFFGKRLFKRDNKKLNISVLAALTVLVVFNMLNTPASNEVVTDKVVIQASPEQVWKHVVSFERIKKEPEFWLFRIGLPSPVESTAEGGFVGANRLCIFTDGIVFEEKIVEYEPGRKLTFDIVKQPEHPEIMGHLNLLRGQFILEDNGDGTTTLIGHSWYDLKVKPSFYFDWWTQSILSSVHIRVMDHIKELSEKEAAL
jgi:uncharacterized protein YndB with AHSA1/START domain